jgi:hypothetical protein
MERRIGFDLRPMARHAVSFAAGACVASAAAYLVARYVEGSMGGPSSFVAQFLELAAGGLVGLAVYVAWARVFRLPELSASVNLARVLVGRRGPARTEPLDG